MQGTGSKTVMRYSVPAKPRPIPHTNTAKESRIGKLLVHTRDGQDMRASRVLQRAEGVHSRLLRLFIEACGRRGTSGIHHRVSQFVICILAVKRILLLLHAPRPSRTAVGP